MPNRSASIKTLCQLKGVDPSTARHIRDVWCKHTRKELAELLESMCIPESLWRTVSTRQRRRLAINEIFVTHGVEYSGQHKRTRAEVYYCNAGDTYAGTIIFNGHMLMVGTWGDLIEKN